MIPIVLNIGIKVETDGSSYDLFYKQGEKRIYFNDSPGRFQYGMFHNGVKLIVIETPFEITSYQINWGKLGWNYSDGERDSVYKEEAVWWRHKDKCLALLKFAQDVLLTMWEDVRGRRPRAVEWCLEGIEGEMKWIGEYIPTETHLIGEILM